MVDWLEKKNKQRHKNEQIEAKTALKAVAFLEVVQLVSFSLQKRLSLLLQKQLKRDRAFWSRKKFKVHENIFYTKSDSEKVFWN